MTDITTSNSLADLAARIKSEHEAVAIALKDSVRHAIAAGEMLLEAKKQVGQHGQWLPWLREYCTISERTAQLYMRCAKNRTAIEEQIRNGVADLSLNEAAAMLSLSSDMKKLFDFMRQVERLTDPEEIMQLCLDLGVAQFIGKVDYESDYTVEQRREWDIFILFLVRRGWLATYADDHVCWLKRHDYKTPSEWMSEEGNTYREACHLKPMPERAMQEWKDFLLQMANLDRVAINKLIGEDDKALRDKIIKAGRNPDASYRPKRRKKRATAQSRVSLFSSMLPDLTEAELKEIKRLARNPRPSRH